MTVQMVRLQMERDMRNCCDEFRWTKASLMKQKQNSVNIGWSCVVHKSSQMFVPSLNTLTHTSSPSELGWCHPLNVCLYWTKQKFLLVNMVILSLKLVIFARIRARVGLCCVRFSNLFLAFCRALLLFGSQINSKDDGEISTVNPLYPGWWRKNKFGLRRRTYVKLWAIDQRCMKCLTSSYLASSGTLFFQLCRTYSDVPSFIVYSYAISCDLHRVPSSAALSQLGVKFALRFANRFEDKFYLANLMKRWWLLYTEILYTFFSAESGNSSFLLSQILRTLGADR